MSFKNRSLDLIKNVTVNLTVELGRVNMKLSDILNLNEDSIVSLDRLTDDFLDVFVNGNLIAKGEIVTEGNHFGLRIIEMVGANDPSDEGEN